jgi:membrane peptidoglycan carboxypeptidase
MRDIVYHKICMKTGSMSDILEDEHNPLRRSYLVRFAEQESIQYLNRFYDKYRGKTSEEQLQLILQNVYPTPARLAAVYRFVNPAAGIDEFSAFLKTQKPVPSPGGGDSEMLYEKYGPGKWSLQDRGCITRVHPLELWLAAYLRSQPDAARARVLEASTKHRQQIYQWLFKGHSKKMQDARIRTLLESDAFADISRSWKKTGYPFDSLVPSYATAIGSSADRPSSLAELVGIILNAGIRYPVARIDELHFAAGTPYETVLRRKELTGERVLSPEIASVIRGALINTVERGTAQSLYSAFVSSTGALVTVGGKTGTGDNRHESSDRRGRIIQSRVVSRAAVFVFFIGDRFFGTITAYVSGPRAAVYEFTSSLPVRILKMMAPKLNPLLEKSEPTLPITSVRVPSVPDPLL